ncbi:MAG TPA: hypothetical protein VN642_09305 [Dongiaceae bacterium]|nr:hypothetical protein [Dongiaceae bacterium]
MKRLIFTASLIVLVVGTVSPARAELKTIGTGANMNVDITGFPPAMKEIYPLFVKKCIKCHGMDRTFVTIQTGMTPSGSVFDNAAVDAYGSKMLRKPDADMTKQDVKKFMELMKFMLDEAAK